MEELIFKTKVQNDKNRRFSTWDAKYQTLEGLYAIFIHKYIRFLSMGMVEENNLALRHGTFIAVALSPRVLLWILENKLMLRYHKFSGASRNCIKSWHDILTNATRVLLIHVTSQVPNFLSHFLFHKTTINRIN